MAAVRFRTELTWVNAVGACGTPNGRPPRRVATWGRTRQMIAAWQQKSGAPATGFVSAAQRDELFRSAASAIARWEDEQKKLEDDKKKAEELAKAPAAVPAPIPPSPKSDATVKPPDPSRQATAAGPVRANASMVGLPSNIVSCDRTAGLALVIHPDKIEIKYAWGWETLPVGEDGSFSGQIRGPSGRWSVQGNVRSKTIRVENLNTYRCTWTGAIR